MKLACALLVLIAGVVFTAAGQTTVTAHWRDQVRAGKNDEVSRRIQHELAALIIPHLELRNDTVRDAIEKVREELRKAYPYGPGVSIFLKLPAGYSEAEALKVNLSLDHVSVLNAYRDIAAQVGLMVNIEPYALAIVPRSDADDRLITAQFPLTSDWLATLMSEPKRSTRRPFAQVPSSAVCQQLNLTPWLTGQGIGFPPGSSATFLCDKAMLVVRNTADNLDLIESLVTVPNAHEILYRQ